MSKDDGLAALWFGKVAEHGYASEKEALQKMEGAKSATAESPPGAM
jgi:hypothetical protein